MRASLHGLHVHRFRDEVVDIYIASNGNLTVDLREFNLFVLIYHLCGPDLNEICNELSTKPSITLTINVALKTIIHR
jgi:hypothetical protein